jgi:HAD superfamily hydrolase (TIGR01509 family)
MFDAVLLEFENVIACTREARRAALARGLADDGVELDAGAFDEHWSALPTREAAALAAARAGAALDPTALDLAVLRAERAFAEQVGKGLTLAPGARAFVEHAHGRARLAIVTRASRREVEFVLQLAGLAAAFECVVSADDAPAPRPSPAGHAAALARLGRRRPAARPLALEDSLLGVRAAQAAGARCVAVGALAAYQAAAADAYVASLDGHTLDTISRLVTRGQERVPHE